MMNGANYSVQNTVTQPPVYQQPVYTQQPVNYQQQYAYPQVNYQQPAQTVPAAPQQYAYPQINYQTPPQSAPVYPQATQIQQPQQISQAQQVPPLDKERIAVQLNTELVAECAALVELNRLAVNVTKEIEKTQDAQKKARLQTHSQDLNQLIAMREAKVNQLQAQCKQYEQ